MKILKPLLLTTILTLSSQAAFIKGSVNQCKASYVENIKNRSIYSEDKKVYTRGLQLGKLVSFKKSEKFTEQARYLYYKPYDSQKALEFVLESEKITSLYGIEIRKTNKNVYNPYSSKAEKLKRFNLYTREYKVWEVFQSTVIFGNSQDLNREVKYLVERFKDENKKIYSMLLAPTYKNLLFLEKIEYFKSNKGKRMFMEELEESRISQDDQSWKLLYKMFKGTITKDDITGGPKKALAFKKKIDQRLSKCYQKNFIINAKKKVYSTEKIIQWYAASIAYPEKKKDLLQLYYSITTNTNLWLYLDYVYNKGEGHYARAARSLGIMVGQEKSPEYLTNSLAKILSKGAQENLENREYYKAWTMSKRSIGVLFKLKEVGQAEIDEMVTVKRVLRDSAQVLINHFAEKNDKETAANIYNVTDDIILTVYKKRESKKIKRLKQKKLSKEPTNARYKKRSDHAYDLN